jgi:hypothetical protein
MNVKKSLKLIVALTCFGSLMACSESNEDATEASVTISGQFANAGSLSLGKLAAEDYQVNCVSFAEVPVSRTSQVDSAGRFSLSMPQGIPFGCFVLDNNNAPVATIVKQAAGSGFASGSSSFSLDSNANFGELDLNLETGQVSVPADRIADAESRAPAVSLDLANVHNNSYELQCISTGNQTYDAACSEFVADSPSVYLRIIEGQEDNNPVYGLGVWESSAAFTACGAIDMRDEEESAIIAESSAAGSTLSFTQVVTGNDYSVSGNCPLRDQGASAPYFSEQLELYYALGPLASSAGGWTLHQEDDVVTNNGCDFHHSLAVSFRAGSRNNMIGNFNIKEHYHEQSANACQGQQGFKASFPVRFVRQ